MLNAQQKVCPVIEQSISGYTAKFKAVSGGAFYSNCGDIVRLCYAENAWQLI
ncbi:hypothetical protein SDC9_174821 [bioreactor metagenome]|uniref:Uncharacterized protein n=1 Tax=bioreactor metagenome TaxID=1076179 RepID=A0A645GNA9_9ZZZZ